MAADAADGERVWDRPAERWTHVAVVYDTVGPAMVSDAFDLAHMELASGLGCSTAAASGDTDAVAGGAALARAPCADAFSLGGGAWPTHDSMSHSSDDALLAHAHPSDRYGALLNILHEDVLKAYYAAPPGGAWSGDTGVSGGDSEQVDLTFRPPAGSAVGRYEKAVSAAEAGVGGARAALLASMGK